MRIRIRFDDHHDEGRIHILGREVIFSNNHKLHIALGSKPWSLPTNSEFERVG
jgi:hypothetical protein